MKRGPRAVSTPILAQELCIEAFALVGESGQFVLLELLSARLGVSWEQLRQAVTYAEHKGWIEARADSIALAREDHRSGRMNGHPPIDGMALEPLFESEIRLFWPPARRTR